MCEQHGKKLVIGTTGFTDAQRQKSRQSDG
ncbi:dihydrodipicolinate reductase [Vibrio cholerae]|nr:dihydrodipicolinate reductase [Vibrio cholerae]